MFKYFKKKSLISEIDQLKLWLKDFTEKTLSIKGETFHNIMNIKEEKKLSWDTAFEEPQIRKELYELMLHRQFIGQMAENLRQKTYELYKLEGHAPSPLNKEKYSEVIEHGVCPNEMEALFNLFIEEIKPNIEKYELEVS
jgi:translation elongation factor EF-G